MQIIPVRSLKELDFSDLGEHYDFLNPSGFHFGQSYYDKVLLPLPGLRPIGFSDYVVQPPEEADEIIVASIERNTACPEVLLPLDGDIICYAAPASRMLFSSLIQAFIVPKGTMVMLHAGVWHKDCFAASDAPVHVLLGAQQLTYSSDAVEHVELPFGDWVKIDPHLRVDDH